MFHIRVWGPLHQLCHLFLLILAHDLFLKPGLPEPASEYCSMDSFLEINAISGAKVVPFPYGTIPQPRFRADIDVILKLLRELWKGSWTHRYSCWLYCLESLLETLDSASWMVCEAPSHLLLGNAHVVGPTASVCLLPECFPWSNKLCEGADHGFGGGCF